MNKRINRYLLILTFVAGLFLFGCKEVVPIDCPFSEIEWKVTEEELIASEGEAQTTYDSTYGGTTYTYEGSYVDRPGTIKYMYDEEGVLMSIAWAYSASTDEELEELYNELHKMLKEEHGRSEYAANDSTNYGDVWKLKEGHIILSVMNTESNKALQLAYVNPLNQEK